MSETPWIGTWIGSCPFCGGRPEVEVFIRCVRIKCSRCGATCAAYYDEEYVISSIWPAIVNRAYEQAARSWNRETEGEG